MREIRDNSADHEYPGLLAIGLGAEIPRTGRKACVASVSIGASATPCSTFTFLAPLVLDEVGMFRHLASGALVMSLHPCAAGGHALIFHEGSKQILMVPLAMDDPVQTHVIAYQVVAVFKAGRVVSYPLPGNDPSQLAAHPAAVWSAYLQ